MNESHWNGKPEDWGAGYYRDIPWSKYVIKCRERQKSDLDRSLNNDPDFPFYFDWDASQRVVDFFSKLRHIDGEWAGQPFILSDWQEWDVIRVLFGWKRRDNNYRRFVDAFLAMARKNAKSTLAAGIADYMTIGDQEFGAQTYSAATKESQARIVFDIATKLIQFSPELCDEIDVFKKSYTNSMLDAVFRPLGRDSKTQDGFSPHCGIVDEFHEHKNSGMYDVIDDGRMARRQSLLLTITTAGFNVNGPCKKLWDTAIKILEGLLDNPYFYAFVATVDDPEKWRDREEHIKANPNWGITVKPEKFESAFIKAKSSSEKQHSFKTKNLNIWTEEAIRWIPAHKYSKCDGPINLDYLKGKRCFAGLDLGITRDLSALALAFMDDRDAKGFERIHLLMKYWIPEVGMRERSENDGVPYVDWVNQGWMTATPGDATRYDYIRRDINALRDTYEIQEIAMDRAHAHELMQQLTDDGMTVIKHGQNHGAMNFPCRSFEELILQQRLVHGNDPVLRAAASVVVIKKDGYENIKVIKHNEKERVDPVVAAVMAIGRLLIAPEPVRPIYESRGLVLL